MAQQQEIGDDVGNALQQFLAAGTVDMRFDAGPVRLVFTYLPGRTACVAARDEDGVLWIACDDEKPWARGQAAEMLADMHLCPEVFGIRELDLRRIPIQGTRGRCRLALVR